MGDKNSLLLKLKLFKDGFKITVWSVVLFTILLLPRFNWSKAREFGFPLASDAFLRCVINKAGTFCKYLKKNKTNRATLILRAWFWQSNDIH